MGANYSEEEDIDEEKEDNKKEEEQKDDKKQKDESLILVSSKNPINKNKQLFLADNIYLDKKSNLGKKRHRPEDSNIQNNQNKEEFKSGKGKIINNNINELNEKKFIKNNIYLKEEQNIKAEFIGNKKFKKLEIEPSLNVTYSNEKIKNNKNEIHNAINFSIDKLYDNKIEREEKSKKKLMNPYNCQVFLRNDEISEKEEKEEKKNNTDEKLKPMIDNIFIYPSDNSKIKNKIIKIPQQSEKENKEKENLNKFIKEEELYSYECLTESLYVRGVKGIKELFIDIVINNNGKLDWPKDDIFLKSDDKYSQIPSKEIKIISLKTGWESEERIVFNNLENKLPGIYKSYIYLNINGRKYGKPMIIEIEILENEEEKRINNSINKMRNEYQIPQNEISDEQLKNALIKNDFDSKKAFQYLFVD